MRKAESDDFFYRDPGKTVYSVLPGPAGGLQVKGPMLFSFDKKNVLNFWQDFPDNFTDEQIKIFSKDYPELAEFMEEKA